MHNGGAKPIEAHVTAPQGEPWRDVINPGLITLALLYLAWSYFALASSIWARFFLLCYLILRMKPDTILPLMLTCIQVRLLLLPSTIAGGAEDPLADVYESLTGYEAYTFSLPPVLFMARAFLAFWERGATISLGRFPRTLFSFWWIGLPFVVAGALLALPSGRGWTGGLRNYCVLGTCFFGMLMPPLSMQGLRRLVRSFALIGLVLFAIASVAVANTRLLFVLAPICAAHGYMAIRGRDRGNERVLAALALLASGYYCFAHGTFTQKSMWITSLGCAALAWPRVSGKAQNAKPLLAACWAITIVCVVVFAYGVWMNIAEKLQIPEAVLDRMEWKLIADRGPIWLGAINLIKEQPFVAPVPNRPYLVQQRGVEYFWRTHTHNVELDCLRDFGMIAGPIAMLILFGITAMMLRRFSKCGGAATAILTISLFTSVVVGGLTLPFIITDRQAEPILAAAGAAFTTMGMSLRRPPQGVRIPGDNARQPS